MQLKFESNEIPKKNALLRIVERFRSAAMITSAIALTMSAPASAQTQPVVTLQSPDGSVSLTGKLITVDDQSYTIEGALGVISVPRIGVECVGDGCPGAQTANAEPTTSREVVLESINDETRVTGELIGVDGEHYVVRTSLGDFRVKVVNVKCSGEACPEVDTYSPEVTIFGSSPKINSMLAELLRDYAETNGQRVEAVAADDSSQSLKVFDNEGQELVANINLIVKDNQEAIRALASKSADILIGDQQLLENQPDSENAFENIVQSALAFDGQVIVSHHDNPIRDLSLAEINRLATGELTSWRSLGGGDSPITLHMVEESVEAKEWLSGLRASDASGVVTHSSEEQVVEAVNADPNAIGVVHWATANRLHAKMLAVRKSCGLTAQPSQFDLRTQYYPFTRPIYFYGQKAGMHPFAQSFLAWAQGEAAASKVSGWGYTSAKLGRSKIQDMGVAVVHTAAVEPDFDGAEFASMMRELRSADRLSITFRFLTGSTVLDKESVVGIKDLASLLRGNEFADQEVLLVGFADSTGPAAGNTALSERRAKAVYDVLLQEFDEAAREKLNLNDLGFGEQMPVDCNGTDSGRANNRRVEVWARVKK